jgi:hypothetical protein
MLGGPAAADPDAYVEAIGGWQRGRVEMMRAAINAGGRFEEGIKWGNLVFIADGLAILIRSEEHRVLLGFWRGKRLTAIEPRLKPSGRYELANLVITEPTDVDPVVVTRLASAAARLNREFGDPTRLPR